MKQDSISDAEEGDFQDGEVADIVVSRGGGEEGSLRARRRNLSSSSSQSVDDSGRPATRKANWRRILLLIVAVTVHNIPGGR